MNSRHARSSALQADKSPSVTQKLQRRRRMLAIGSSALAHIAVGIFLFGSASGELVSSGANGGGPEGPVFAVELVSASDLSSSPSATASQFQPLFAKYDMAAIDAVPVQSGQASDFSRLAAKLTRLGHDGSDEHQPTSAGAPHPAPRPLRVHDGRANSTFHGGGTAKSGSTGELWGRIEPCWRRIRGVKNIPVSLEIKLDLRGRLETPPRILRARTDVVDEARLKAEAAAVEALAACLPRNGTRFSGQVHKLEFVD